MSGLIVVLGISASCSGAIMSHHRIAAGSRGRLYIFGGNKDGSFVAAWWNSHLMNHGRNGGCGEDFAFGKPIS